ncbi:MAG: hypothetical protein IKM77_03855 [Prevotella sp.]|nr:hypothetical protein [Prevotella sp.]
MKKNYNIPAIEVVTLASGMIMLGESPVQDPANPTNNDPGAGQFINP